MSSWNVVGDTETLAVVASVTVTGSAGGSVSENVSVPDSPSTTEREDGDTASSGSGGSTSSATENDTGSETVDCCSSPGAESNASAVAVWPPSARSLTVTSYGAVESEPTGCPSTKKSTRSMPIDEPASAASVTGEPARNS